MRTIIFVLGFSFGLIFGSLGQLLFVQLDTAELPEHIFTSNAPQIVAHAEASIESARPKNGVLCWVLALKVTESIRLRLLTTWGNRCERFVFVAKDGTPSEDVIVHGYQLKGEMDLFNQAHRGWTIIGERYGNSYDWFVKLDTDSFFIVDNFLFLAKEKGWRPDDVVYFGHTIFEQSRPITEARAQFNLGAGYGVSRRLLLDVLPYLPTARSKPTTAQKCPEWIRWAEDVKFADCMRFKYPNLLPNATRDKYDREAFIPFDLAFHLLFKNPPWYFRGKDPSLLEKQKAFRCCGSRPVLWHTLNTAGWFWAFHYFHFGVAVDPIRVPRN
jgi:hypothetical protein